MNILQHGNLKIERVDVDGMSHSCSVCHARNYESSRGPGEPMFRVEFPSIILTFCRKDLERVANITLEASRVL